MKLWIFHHYATLPNLNGHTRPYRFAEHLKSDEVETTIFAAAYQHFSGDNLIQDKRKYLVDTSSGVSFVFIKTPSSATGGIARVKNMIAFYRGLLSTSKKYAQKNRRPDVVLASSPQPLAMVAGIKIAKCFKVPCICEVRDLWPEAIFSATRLKENGFIGKILTCGEHWIYHHADALIFTKEGDTDYIKERRWDTEHGGDIELSKCHYINNGVELDSYNRQIVECQLDDPDIKKDSFHVVYAGAIRRINNVGNILDAAKRLLDYPNIDFLIYGDGNEVDALNQRIVAEDISNVKMKGFVEKKYIPYILSRSSANLLNYSQDEYNWSRGNSSNKLFEYMASGKPVISTVKMSYSIIEKYQCGIELDGHTPKALADAILSLRNMPEDEYCALGNNAKLGAKDFDYAALSEKLLEVINPLVRKHDEQSDALV